MKKKIILYYETHAWYFIVSKKKIKRQTGGYEKSRVKGKRGETALLCTLQSWSSQDWTRNQWQSMPWLPRRNDKRAKKMLERRGPDSN